MKFTKYQERGSYHWSATYRTPLTKANPKRHGLYDQALNAVKRNYPNWKELRGMDIGCGDGVLLHKASRLGLQIVGLDIEMSGLRLAAHELNLKQTPYAGLVCANCCSLPWPSASLDFLLSTEVIEHLEKPGDFLAEVRRVLKQGGVFVCSTPHRFPGTNGVRDPFHIHEFDVQEFRELLSEHFQNVNVRGVFPLWLNSIYDGWSGMSLLDKMTRFGLRLFSAIYNPYSNLLYANPLQNNCEFLLDDRTWMRIFNSSMKENISFA